jgi:PncC family amidohydrolase
MDPYDLSGRVLDAMRARSLRLATAESCTGGLVSTLLTDHAGSSDVYLGGWVAYSNPMKGSQLGVSSELLGPGGPGAVSRETAEAMARGALERSGADVAVAITGIAGPGGGNPEKPVGTVWIACATRARVRSAAHRFEGDRRRVRESAAAAALELVLAAVAET